VSAWTCTSIRFTMLSNRQCMESPASHTPKQILIHVFLQHYLHLSNPLNTRVRISTLLVSLLRTCERAMAYQEPVIREQDLGHLIDGHRGPTLSQPLACLLPNLRNGCRTAASCSCKSPVECQSRSQRQSRPLRGDVKEKPQLRGANILSF